MSNINDRLREREEDMNKYEMLYQRLYSLYGPQGWWPISKIGYHKDDYDYPKNNRQCFEVCVGAILTQNTSWINVEKAIKNLESGKLLDADSLIMAKEDLVKGAIRPAGYYNQKYRKLIGFSRFFLMLKNKVPTREQLLALWGIGPETADSILLYAYRQPVFVIDAYTKRVLMIEKMIDSDGDMDYTRLQEIFHDNIDKDYRIYQEFHALLVEHAKNIKKTQI